MVHSLNNTMICAVVNRICVIAPERRQRGCQHECVAFIIINT